MKEKEKLSERERLVQLVKTHIKIEEEHVKQLTEMEKTIGYAAAKLLLLEMRLDSQKHAGILNGILDTLKGTPANQNLWEYRLGSYVDPLVAKKTVENHIKMESDVLAHVEDEIKHTKDEGLKLLLRHIAEDEKKHHEILETIVKNVHRIGK